MIDNHLRRKTTLLPKMLMVCLGGYAIASVASVEAPDSVKLMQLERKIESNTHQIAKHANDIEQIKDKIEIK